ncbi:hypothetical protein GGG16DRAFT_118386 [Schizophyllum commune]
MNADTSSLSPLSAPTLGATRTEGEAETASEVVARMKAAGYVDFGRVLRSYSLVENPQMRELNLAFNPVAQLLICVKCHVQVPRKFRGHLRHCHPLATHGPAGSSDDAVEDMLAALGVPMQMRVFEPTLEPRLLIEGLRSTYTYGCSSCSYSHSHRARVAAHTVTCASVAHVLDGVQVQQPHPNRREIRVVLPGARTHALVDQLLTFTDSLRDEIIDGPIHPRRENSLLRFTNWTRFMLDHDVDEVRSAARYPSPNEFGNLYGAVLRYIGGATAHLDSVDSLAAQLLQPADFQVAILNHTRHDRVPTELAIHQCRAIVTRLLATLLRRHKTEFDLCVHSWLEGCLDSLDHWLSSPDPLHEGKRVRAIHEVLTALWLSEYPNPASSDGLADPTLACLCMQAVNADGSYMQTGEYASVLAHLTRAIGLCVATEIHAVVAEHAPCLPPDSHLSHLAGTRVDGIRSLLRWVDENNWSTYATLRAHERHARALLGSALYQNLWWVDTHNHTELSIGGYRLTLDHLRSIASNLQSKIVDSFQRLTADLPTTIAYDVLADDLHNDVSGYSAIDLLWHNRPEQFADFARRLLDHPALGLTRDMNAELAVKPTRAWLQALERHELLTLVYVQLTCGGPARGTGPIRLSMRNPTGALRSLHILGGRVCLVLPSMDSSSAYERDEVIVIPLDGFIGDMLIRTLAFCRRVAEFLVNKLSPSSAAESARLYRDLCFTALGRPFTSDDVSNALAAESFPTIGFDLHLPLFRMGFRAWNNALVPKYHATGDGDDGGLAEPLDALRAGYGCERGRHLQGLCRHDFRGTPLARLHVQMHNVDRWQIILNLQPGGKRVPYYEARSTLEAAPAPGIQAPAPSTPRQLAQLLTSQIASVTALARTLTQQSDRLRLEVSGLRAHIDSPDAPIPQPTSSPTALATTPLVPGASSAAQPQYENVLSIESTHPSAEAENTANAAEQDGSLSSLSDMQISSPPCTYLARSSHRLSDLMLAEYNPRASSFIPTDLRSRGNSNASMGSPLPDALPSRVWRDPDQVRLAFSYTSPDGLLKSFASRRPLFPREDGLHFMDARPYHDPYHIPPSDAICVARRLLGDPDAQWMSDAQYGAVSAMAGLERDLCIIMRHGGGKSLAVIIPTVFEDGITVIIVPFDALARRWAKRLDGLRIAYELFDSGSEDISGDKKIVLHPMPYILCNGPGYNQTIRCQIQWI